MRVCFEEREADDVALVAVVVADEDADDGRRGGRPDLRDLDLDFVWGLVRPIFLDQRSEARGCNQAERRRVMLACDCRWFWPGEVHLCLPKYL